MIQTKSSNTMQHSTVAYCKQLIILNSTIDSSRSNIVDSPTCTYTTNSIKLDGAAPDS